MKQKYILEISAVVLVLIGVGIFMLYGERGGEGVEVPLGNPVTFLAGDTIVFEGGARITLREINDSRCPEGVVCIWQGELSPVFRLEQGGTTPQEIRLGTETTPSVNQGGYMFVLESATETSATITVTKAGEQIYCTQDAKLCPDGSYVGRTGPNCEFAECPVPGPDPNPGMNCTKDSDCPSSRYVCEATQGMGTACPSNDPSCVPTYTVIAGECKLKEGNGCSVDADCSAGNLCHKNMCVSPIGSACSGPSDTSCPADFECVEGCGPPVVRYPDDTSPSYFCQLNGYMRPCPICLAKNTLIDTPFGGVPVQYAWRGMPVWTVNTSGDRTLGIVIETSKTAVALDHKMVRLILSDERELLVSPGHPIADGRTAEDFISGDVYDGAIIITSEKVSYTDEYTYDVLPSGETGFYFANNILLGSTLRSRGN